MNLKITEVSRCLDKKIMVLGFEVPDLLIIFLTISILNYLFGTSNAKWLFVWTPSLLLTVLIRYTKRGKPDNYLLHWLRFQMKPSVIGAFADPKDWSDPPRTSRATQKKETTL